MSVRSRLRKNSVASQVSQCAPDSMRGTVSKIWWSVTEENTQHNIWPSRAHRHMCTQTHISMPHTERKHQERLILLIKCSKIVTKDFFILWNIFLNDTYRENAANN